MTQIQQKKVTSIKEIIFSKRIIPYLILFVVLCLALWGGYSLGSLIFFIVIAIVSCILIYLSGKYFLLHNSLVEEHMIISRELHTLFHDFKDGIIVYSPQFKILYINPAAEDIFAISAEKYIGTTTRPDISAQPELKILTQTIFPSLASSVLQISEAHEWPQIVEILIDDPEMKFYTALSRVTDRSGKVLFFIKVIKDETRERSILRSKNEFINTAAHQLRTPLTAINWALESIKNISKDVSSDIESVATEALGVSERALKITNDLLDVAKMEEGRFGYKFETYNIIEIIRDVVGALKLVAAQKNIIFSFNYGTMDRLDVPRVDRERLGMALFNLIDNAIKYTLQNGTVKILLTKDDTYAYVDISDSGVGIAEEDIKNLFKKFFRGSNIEQLEPNGNGLGLFITKNIIERHGGKISVTSQLNRGTTFRISIPLKDTLVPEFEKAVTYQEEL